jgi:hypothetical protein
MGSSSPPPGYVRKLKAVVIVANDKENSPDWHEAFISITKQNFLTNVNKERQRKLQCFLGLPHTGFWQKYNFLYIFLACWSALAIPLLMSPIFVFLRDVWIRTQSSTYYFISSKSETSIWLFL